METAQQTSLVVVACAGSPEACPYTRRFAGTRMPIVHQRGSVPPVKEYELRTQVRGARRRKGKVISVHKEVAANPF